MKATYGTSKGLCVGCDSAQDVREFHGEKFCRRCAEDNALCWVHQTEFVYCKCEPAGGEMVSGIK